MYSKKHNVAIISICIILLVVCTVTCVFTYNIYSQVKRDMSEEIVSENIEYDSAEYTENSDPHFNDSVGVTLTTEYDAFQDSGEITSTLSNYETLAEEIGVDLADRLKGYAELIPSDITYYPGEVVYIGYSKAYSQCYFTMEDEACDEVVVMSVIESECGPTGEIINREEAKDRMKE